LQPTVHAAHALAASVAQEWLIRAQDPESIMEVLAAAPDSPADPVALAGVFRTLVDDKAWHYLGLTGEEFRLEWYAGMYVDDARPAVRALDRLMRTGEWVVIE